MISCHSNCQKFNEKVERYQIIPLNWGWRIGKWVLMHCFESKKWCNFLKDNLTISGKLINAWSHLARPCLEFTLQKYLCNFTKIVYMILTAIFSPIMLENLSGPLPHTAVPPCNLCSQSYQYRLVLPHLELLIGEGNGNSFQFSCLGNPMDAGAW